MAKRHFLVFRKFYYNRADWNSIHEILDSLKWIIWKISHYVGSNSWRMECLACKGCPICTYCAIIFIPWQEELRLKDDQKTRSGLIKSVVFCASWNFHDSELFIIPNLYSFSPSAQAGLPIVTMDAPNQRSNGNWASYFFEIDHIVVHSNGKCGNGAMNCRLCPKQIMFLIHSNECLWWYNYTMGTKDYDTLITLLCIHQRFFLIDNEPIEQKKKTERK